MAAMEQPALAREPELFWLDLPRTAMALF